MKVKVKVTKVNAGVSFELPPKGRLSVAKMRRALVDAVELYKEAASTALDETFGVKSNAAYSLLRVSATLGERSAFLPLEPWGFARRDEDGRVVMANTGSTPTDSRARALLCYQAPLEEVDRGNGQLGFERVYEVEV